MKSVMAVVFSFFATSFIAQNACADAYFRIEDSKTGKYDWVAILSNWGNYDQIYRLNGTYFGNAMDFEDHSWGFNIKWVRFPGHYKRFGVFKVEKSVNGQKDGSREDLSLSSKEEADRFCGDLISANKNASSVFVSDSGGGVKQVIAVAYRIAYDTGSTLSSDGNKSTPAQKHVICPNPWKWGLNPSKITGGGNDENESTGILASNLTDAKDGYEVKCMNSTSSYFLPSKDLPGYWTNGKLENTYKVYVDNPTEHQLNVNVGSKYCPVSD